MAQKCIYLDHAGLAPVSLRVKVAVQQFLTESVEGGALHYPKWTQQIIGIRRACERLINAEPGGIAFVKNTSHGLSLVAGGLGWKRGDNVLIYEKDFPSNLYPWMNLGRRGVEVKSIPSHEGSICIADIDRLMDSRTRLVAISSVQFASGFRVDLGKLGALCRRRNVLLCVDAIQSLGVIPMDVKKYHIDFLSADAHKWLLGPEGIGIFYCRRDLTDQINPLLIGWKSMQHELDFDNPAYNLKPDALRFEEGSMNLLGILGLGAAVDLLDEVGIEKIERRVQDLGDLIIQEAKERGHSVLTPKARQERGGNITFSGKFDPMLMKDRLSENGIMVNARGGGLRVSPHFYNKEEEILEFFNTLDRLVVSTGAR